MLELNVLLGGIKLMAHENNKMHHEPTRYTINIKEGNENHHFVFVNAQFIT